MDHLSALEERISEVAGLLRRSHSPAELGRAMLPMVLLRRLDCLMDGTQERVLAEFQRLQGKKLRPAEIDAALSKAAGLPFHNWSDWNFERLEDKRFDIHENLKAYIDCYSANVREILRRFDFQTELDRMEEIGILSTFFVWFTHIDLRPENLSDAQMGVLFERLVRRYGFSERIRIQSVAPDVARLAAALLCGGANARSRTDRPTRALDPFCGSGGMLAEVQSLLLCKGDSVSARAFGQESDDLAFATAASRMLLTQAGQESDGQSVRPGNSLEIDRFRDQDFDYLIAAPPIGFDWRRLQGRLQRRHQSAPKRSPWSAGLPGTFNGSLLFLQHVISKFADADPDAKGGGSRAAVLLPSSSLTAGGIGGGESDIRKWIIERDMLEAIVLLPRGVHGGTQIGVCLWILASAKSRKRRSRIQIIDTRDAWPTESKLGGGSRRRAVQPRFGSASERRATEAAAQKNDASDPVADIINTHRRFKPDGQSRILDNADLGFTRVVVERPLRLRYQMTLERKEALANTAPLMFDDVQAIDKALGRKPMDDWNRVLSDISEILKARRTAWLSDEIDIFRDIFTETYPDAKKVRKGDGFEPDGQLRQRVNIPLKDDVDAYFGREILPHVPEAWLDRSQDRVGYEIDTNLLFREITSPRTLESIDAELARVNSRLQRQIGDIAA